MRSPAKIPGSPSIVLHAVLSVVLAVSFLLGYVAASRAGAVPPIEARVIRLIALPVPSDPGLMYAIAATISGAMIGVYVYGRRLASVEEELEKQVVTALRIYHTVAEASGSPLEAVRLLRKSIGEDPIATMLSSIEALMSRGVPMEDAFKRVFSGAPRHVSLVAQTIPVAQRGGARMREVLESALSYAREIGRMRRTMASRLAPYKYVLAMANILFSSVAGVTIGLLDLINRGGLVPGIRAAVTTEELTAMLWFSSLVVALASSIIAGRVISGKAPLGGLLASAFVALNTIIILNIPGIFGALG
ncbi:MAG: type II secretion system F family protein [Desulfurococcales archaeon]|nr:type II secretion system F family protein [Desulfurococcales archaeon]